jgi:hypothetical protein
VRLPEAAQQKTNQVQVELAAALAKRRRGQGDRMNELRTARSRRTAAAGWE